MSSSTLRVEWPMVKNVMLPPCLAQRAGTRDFAHATAMCQMTA